MNMLRKKTEDIRRFIMANVQQYPKEIAHVTAQQFSITRQAVNKHIQCLVEQKVLAFSGTTRNKVYRLQSTEWTNAYVLNKNLEEQVIWENDILPCLGILPENIHDIWQYGFTEMFNNAIEHSLGKNILVSVSKTVMAVQITISDDGEGIFKKIQREKDLIDERHAMFELAKGKLTTDPDNHTGEGIFFSSRMFDEFWIISGSVAFTHAQNDNKDWFLEPVHSGTFVMMKLDNNVTRTSKEIFDEYATDEDYGFTKTVIPVRLAQYGSEKLISRSQAKRLLARIDRFKIVIFDFDTVKTIGQAFADEIFRVFRKQYPHIELHHINACKDVEQMISRAKFRAD